MKLKFWRRGTLETHYDDGATLLDPTTGQVLHRAGRGCYALTSGQRLWFDTDGQLLMRLGHWRELMEQPWGYERKAVLFSGVPRAMSQVVPAGLDELALDHSSDERGVARITQWDEFGTTVMTMDGLETASAVVDDWAFVDLRPRSGDGDELVAIATDRWSPWDAPMQTFVLKQEEAGVGWTANAIAVSPSAAPKVECRQDLEPAEGTVFGFDETNYEREEAALLLTETGTRVAQFGRRTSGELRWSCGEDWIGDNPCGWVEDSEQPRSLHIWVEDLWLEQPEMRLVDVELAQDSDFPVVADSAGDLHFVLDEGTEDDTSIRYIRIGCR